MERVYSPQVRTPHGFFVKPSADCGWKDYVQQASQSLGFHSAIQVKQEHTNKALIWDSRQDVDLECPADALVTREVGVALAIQTADCAPVIFYDNSGIVGIAHAGWRGAVSGVLDNTLQAMKQLGALKNNLYAVIGPTIRIDHYEVQPDFAEHITKHSAFSVEKLFRYVQGENSKEGTKIFFNLPGYVKSLVKDHVNTVYDTGWDTFASRFASYRYSQQHLGSRTERFVSMVGLPHLS